MRIREATNIRLSRFHFMVKHIKPSQSYSQQPEQLLLEKEQASVTTT